ncbi:hypothetical protein ACS384_000415, partial [Klebsiella oxytoca]
MGVGGTCDSENHLILANCLPGCFPGLNAGDCFSDCRFAAVIIGCRRGNCLLLLFCFARFGPGDRGLDGGLARVNGSRLFCGGGRFSRGCLLARFARFGPGDRGLDGGLA